LAATAATKTLEITGIGARVVMGVHAWPTRASNWRMRPFRRAEEECAMTTVTTSRSAGVGQKAAARTEDAVKIYGKEQVEVRALDAVTVEFTAGRYTAIMGPSGSGKSTLLHCAAGLDTLTSGKAYIGEADLTTLNDQRLTILRRDHVGFVFQSFNLVPTITAAENITLPLLLAGRKGDQEWIAKVIETLDIGNRLRHRPAPPSSTSCSPSPASSTGGTSPATAEDAGRPVRDLCCQKRRFARSAAGCHGGTWR
jgi:ABC-type glutathione transport system ATPase component